MPRKGMQELVGSPPCALYGLPCAAMIPAVVEAEPEVGLFCGREPSPGPRCGFLGGGLGLAHVGTDAQRLELSLQEALAVSVLIGPQHGAVTVPRAMPDGKGQGRRSDGTPKALPPPPPPGVAGACCEGEEG